MRRRLLLLLPIVLVVLAGTVMACSVPVFRYAIEHWRPDPYLAIVFHRGELTEAQQALVTKMQPQDDGARGIANLDVRTVDLDADPDETLAALWAEQATDSLPWLVVKAPPKQGPPATVWAGDLNDEHASQLITSPARLELEQRLLNGDSVVWFFLDSGNRQADDAAYAIVQAEVEHLQQVLELPEIEAADLSELALDPAALKLRMSSLRVARDDPAERFLVETLLRVEPDLLDEPFVNQPMAFPVFGRGRALYALVGNGITADTIEEACRFLTGACQCTVKAQNPGVDLLLAVDWDRFIQPSLSPDATPPTLTGFADFAHAAESAVPELSAQVEVEGEDDAGDSHMATADGAPPATAVNITSESDGDAIPDSGPTGAEAAASTPTGSPLPTSSPPSIVGKLVLVMGLLAMGVVVATMVLIPRSR